MPRAYYNDNDPFVAQWLRNLIKEGLIADGDVDDRSIRDVQPGDLGGYTQCHFFAGIGGWSLALRMAEWPEDREVWTGSCPCQPFSVAGKRKGFADERHLWPEFYRLISECAPSVVLGEQVARATVWLDAVFTDLEKEGYACGAAVIPAAGVGAPHKRDRIWFVADSGSAVLRDQSGRSGRPNGKSTSVSRDDGQAQFVAHAIRDPRESRRADNPSEGARRLDADRGRLGPALANANGGDEFGRGRTVQVGRLGSTQETAGHGHARGIEWSAQPGMGVVAHGVPARVGRLRALGNAIVPQVAAEFIKAFQECRP